MMDNNEVNLFLTSFTFLILHKIMLSTLLLIVDDVKYKLSIAIIIRCNNFVR